MDVEKITDWLVNTRIQTKDDKFQKWNFILIETTLIFSQSIKNLSNINIATHSYWQVMLDVAADGLLSAGLHMAML